MKLFTRLTAAFMAKKIEAFNAETFYSPTISSRLLKLKKLNKDIHSIEDAADIKNLTLVKNDAPLYSVQITSRYGEEKTITGWGCQYMCGYVFIAQGTKDIIFASNMLFDTNIV